MSERGCFHIRWMIRRDMPEVLDIEAVCWGQTDRWLEEDFSARRSQRNCIGMVCEVNDTVVGFMVYEIHEALLHVINLAVHPRFQRQGFARQMALKLQTKLSTHRRQRLVVGVAKGNKAGRVYFEQLGFLEQSIDAEPLRPPFMPIESMPILMEWKAAAWANFSGEPQLHKRIDAVIEAYGEEKGLPKPRPRKRMKRKPADLYLVYSVHAPANEAASIHEDDVQPTATVVHDS